MALSVKEIEAARPADKDRKIHDEKGLYLLVAASGSKRWYFKYRFLGREQKLSFGAFPDVSLKVARAKRDEARAQIADGKNPSRERLVRMEAARVEARNTFEVIARELMDKNAAEGAAKATQDKAEWLLSLAQSRLGKLPVAEITAPVAFTLLEEIANGGRRETARRLRSFISRVIDRAVNTGRAPHNPVRSLQRALVTPDVRHHPAIIDPDGLAELLVAIDDYEGYPSTMAALRLTPHLFQRPGEIRSMRWDDLDLDQARWKIPLERMKSRRAHEVPLSTQVIEIIRARIPVSGRSEWVLPAFHSLHRPISENTVNQALRRLGYAGTMTAHGFRSTASSLLNESGKWSPDVIEAALAHKDKDQVRSIYNRTRYWQPRVEMMQAWSDQLDALKAGGLRDRSSLENHSK